LPDADYHDLEEDQGTDVGQVLEVVSDDEGIKQDMPAWCDTTGHQMVGLEEEQTKSGTIYKAFVKKTK